MSCVVTVSVTVEVAPAAKITDMEDRERPGPLGEMLAEGLIVPVNPPMLVSITVDDPEPPTMICIVDGLDVMAKSGGAGCVTVIVCDAVAFAPAESVTSSCTVKFPLVA